MEKQNPSSDKRKSPIESSQIPNSKKIKINPDESLAELKKKGAYFNVERAVFWEKGENVPFMFVAKALNAISKDAISIDSGLIVITEILCNMLRTVIETTPDDLVAVVYLLSKRIVPHQPIGIYISFVQYTVAIANACGVEVEDIENDLKDLGDFGELGDFGDLSLVAQARLSASIPSCTLTAVKVYETFKELASDDVSENEKTDLIKSLLVQATGCEPLCLIRLLLRLQNLPRVKLRLEEQTLLTALGHAALYFENPNVHPRELEEAAKVVKEVYSLVPIYDKLVPDLFRVGVLKLRETCTIAPGIPFVGMLHKQTMGSVNDILDKFQDRDFICEYSYRGTSAMIHYSKEGQNLMEVYCTDGRRITERFLGAASDAVRLKLPSVTSFIIECRLVEKIQTQKEFTGFDPMEPTEACIYAFDMLYLNGELLLQEQLKVRRELLHQSFEKQANVLQFPTASTSTDLEVIGKFLDDALKSGCPRLLFRTLTRDAMYEPATCSENWLELKKDYVKYVDPSLNLVPIAALYRERGKPGDDVTFLLACYDSYDKKFRSLCTLTAARGGAPEAILEERYKILYSNKISDAKPNYVYEYPEGMVPEWFEPTEVWEVRCLSLYEDPYDKRFTLDHPYLARVLADKLPTQASSPDEVVKLADYLMEDTSDEEDLHEEDLSKEDYNSSLDKILEAIVKSNII